MITLLMFSWFPIVIYLFMRFPPQRALIISFVAAWLFLPQAVNKLPSIPVEYNRMSATSFGVLAATCLYDFERFKSFKLHWFDLPMLVWCLCPLISSITNGLGAYDGLSGSIGQTMAWGAPYFLGRIYLNNFAGMRQLALGVFLGGLIYVPLCLFETISHINLHGLLYRFQLSGQTEQFALRLGGYRPAVFLSHGLALATWMMFVTLMGLVLWRTKLLKQVWNIPMSWLVGLLFLTFILLRSTGAYFLLFVGVVIVLSAQQYGTSFFFWLLLAGMFVYLYLSATGILPAQQFIDFLETFIDPERLQSLGFRLMNEEVLSARAREQVLFGWSGYGRNMIFDAEGNAVTVTDSLWIIAFGQNGLVGLISVFGALLLPVLNFWFLYPPSSWSHPNVVVTAVVAVGLALYALDCVLNAMFDPIFILASGGLTGIILNQQRQGVAARSSMTRSVR